MTTGKETPTARAAVAPPPRQEWPENTAPDGGAMPAADKTERTAEERPAEADWPGNAKSGEPLGTAATRARRRATQCKSICEAGGIERTREVASRVLWIVTVMQTPPSGVKTTSAGRTCTREDARTMRMVAVATASRAPQTRPGRPPRKRRRARRLPRVRGEGGGRAEQRTAAASQRAAGRHGYQQQRRDGDWCGQAKIVLRAVDTCKVRAPVARVHATGLKHVRLVAQDGGWCRSEGVLTNTVTKVRKLFIFGHIRVNRVTGQGVL